MSIAFHWKDIDPDHIWRAPNQEINPWISVVSNEPMMRPMHTSTSYSSLSALQQLPSGSNGAGFSCAPPTRHRQPRMPQNNRSEEQQLMENFQNVLLFRSDSQTVPGLGIGPTNPWQMSSAIGSTNGFTSSDSSAPLSPISQLSSDVRKRSVNASENGNRHTKNQGSFHSRRPTNHLNGFSGPPMANNSSKNGYGHHRSNENYQPGMRDLTYWLKMLRLHKYAPLFDKMSYREMMSLDISMLERMKVTVGARKKIMKSIEKLRERPMVLKKMEEDLRSGKQCIRCAVCATRQILCTPFIRYEGNVKNREIIDGINIPLQMISYDNIPALIFRVVTIINSMLFPLKEELRDLEDEYLLTMFYIFDNIINNEQFTPNQQHYAVLMKRNAKKYASPTEMKRHRMGMVASSKCEICHNSEVVNRERFLELQEKQARGELPNYSLFFDELLDNSLTLMPKSAEEKILRKDAASSPAVQLDDSRNLFNFANIWKNIVLDEDFMSHEPSTSFDAPVSMFPEYRSPNHVNAVEVQQPTDGQYTNVMNQATFDFMDVLRGIPESINIDFSFPDIDLLSKANSTGSGYSSSDSESSVISPRSRSMSDEEASRLAANTNFMFHSFTNPPPPISFAAHLNN